MKKNSSSTNTPGQPWMRRLRIERLEMRLALSADPLFGSLPLLNDLSAASGSEQKLLEALFLSRLEEFELGGGRVQRPPQQVQRSSNQIDVRLAVRDDRFESDQEIDVDLLISASEASDDSQLTRRERRNLFQAKLDLRFNPDVLEPLIDQFEFNEEFIVGQPVTDREAGTVNGIGGFLRYIPNDSANVFGPSTNEQGELLLATIPFRALGTGDAGLQAAFPNDEEAFLVFGSDSPVARDNFNTQPLDFTISGLTSEAPEPSVDPIPAPVTPVEVVNILPDRLIDFPQSQPITGLEVAREDADRLTVRFDEDRRFEFGDQESERILDPWELPLGNENQPGSNDENNENKVAASDRATADEETERIRFWSRFDLETLDDEFSPSRLLLHLRTLPLKLSNKDDDSRADKVGERSPSEAAKVVDLGLADVSFWLLDPVYWSWSEARSSGNDTVESSSNEPLDELPTKAGWVPRAKMANLNRLELVEEMASNAAFAQIQLFRRFDPDSVDASTHVPAANVETTNQTPPLTTAE